ncbi:hypothetical protein VTN77DRAFT_4597 [Rasamsonia byssochlamydoides]|uniref:uncharacterized protein n=1 Tax=Rasamsonia byssochlamydoides TaxID=89139 RepID=UPI0037444B2D
MAAVPQFRTSIEVLPSYVAKAVLPLGFPSKEIPALVVAMSNGVTFQASGIAPAILAAASSATKNAWSCAFRMAFLSTVPFGMIATCVAFFIADPSKYFMHHVAIHLDADRGDKNAKALDSLEIGEK